jgi:hypothetical protein
MQLSPVFSHLEVVEGQVMTALAPPLWGVREFYEALDKLWKLTPASDDDRVSYPSTLLVPGTMLRWGKTLHVLARAKFDDDDDDGTVRPIHLSLTRLACLLSSDP